MLCRDTFELDPLQTPNVDGGRAHSFGIGTLAVWMDAADRTVAMLDCMLVEQVGAGVLLGREQSQFVAWHKPHDRALALAHAAVAGHRAFEASFNFELNTSTMTASLVIHRGTPPGDVSTKPRNFA